MPAAARPSFGAGQTAESAGAARPPALQSPVHRQRRARRKARRAPSPSRTPQARLRPGGGRTRAPRPLREQVRAARPHLGATRRARSGGGRQRPGARGRASARRRQSAHGGRFTKDIFDIDLEQAKLTCPGGQTIERTRHASRDGTQGWLFEFGELCSGCPLRANCVSPKAGEDTGRSVFVVPTRERLIRNHLVRRDDPDFRSKLARRVGVEHANARFRRCGGKVARRFRQGNVLFDVRMSALACNLRRLAGLLAHNPELLQRLEAVAAAQRQRRQARRLLILCALMASVAVATAAQRRPLRVIRTFTAGLRFTTLWSGPAPR
ncbi:MAG: hypothetical protein GY743_22940 [Planctomycetaceae bacterium]|nr:hypothetical protein [Planctomycetaceae bacterium]